MFLGRHPPPWARQSSHPNGLPSCIRAGEILAGKYRLERELGRGAMGTVWSAMHLTLGQRVAIKLVSAEHAQSEEARARFGIEAKAAARLKIAARRSGLRRRRDAGGHALHRHGVPGRRVSRSARRTRGHRPARRRGTHHRCEFARALARAHAHGIVHRDLKPGNIFLTRSDEDEVGWLAEGPRFRHRQDRRAPRRTRPRPARSSARRCS